MFHSGSQRVKLQQRVQTDEILYSCDLNEPCDAFSVFSCQIVMVEDVYRGTSEAKRDCSSFVMVKVPKTNVLVVVTESSSCLTAPPKCACHSTCITEEATSCECPCTSHLDYNNCDDTLTGDT